MSECREGGIRILGTCISQDNGLANESFSPPSRVFKQLQLGPKVASRGSAPFIRQLLCSTMCSAIRSCGRYKRLRTKVTAKVALPVTVDFYFSC